jgi:hypothetical protein
MGLKVSARDAARLAGRTERTIRAWVASGKLKAEPTGSRGRRRGVGPNRWQIDTDELAGVPGVTLDKALLAEFEARAALIGGGENVLARLERVERDVAELRRRVEELNRNDQGGAASEG